MNENYVTVGLLSHIFQDDNLGCTALAVSNVILIDAAAKKQNIKIRYKIFVNEKMHQPVLDFTDSQYSYEVYSSCKQTLRHPIKWFRLNIFESCDLVFNLCAGDGFTSIYGMGRTLSESYMTILCSLKGHRIVLSPQTIGPFDNFISRAVARMTLKCCEAVFTRDGLSTACCKQFHMEQKTREVIDAAFALPFEQSVQDEGFHVGVNISGLLYQGGYNNDNYFKLNFNYKDYIDGLLKELLKAGFTVHLIGHVISDETAIEDDYRICARKSKEDKGFVLAPKFTSPIEAKTYISRMNVFTGARMHSTIAAISSGVPVIPIAYSRKVNGLYSTLNYPYYIDAKADETAASAISKTCKWIKESEHLKKCIQDSKKIFGERLKDYSLYLETILCSVTEEREGCLRVR